MLNYEGKSKDNENFLQEIDKLGVQEKAMVLVAVQMLGEGNTAILDIEEQGEGKYKLRLGTVDMYYTKESDNITITSIVKK